MFPLIFQNLCAHKISFVQHFTRTHLYFERRVWNTWKNIFRRNIYVRAKFSCVRLSHGLCARAQLRGNIGGNTSKVADRNVERFVVQGNLE